MLGAALYNMPRANALKQIQEPAQQLPLEQTSKLEPAHQNQTEDLFAAFMKPQGPQPCRQLPEMMAENGRDGDCH